MNPKLLAPSVELSARSLLPSFLFHCKTPAFPTQCLYLAGSAADPGLILHPPAEKSQAGGLLVAKPQGKDQNLAL